MIVKLVLEKREEQALSFTAEQSEALYKETSILYQKDKRSGRTGPKGTASGPALWPGACEHR